MLDGAALRRHQCAHTRAFVHQKEIAPSFALCIFRSAHGHLPSAISNKDRFCAHQQMRSAVYCPQGTIFLPHRFRDMEPLRDRITRRMRWVRPVGRDDEIRRATMRDDERRIKIGEPGWRFSQANQFVDEAAPAVQVSKRTDWRKPERYRGVMMTTAGYVSTRRVDAGKAASLNLGSSSALVRNIPPSAGPMSIVALGPLAQPVCLMRRNPAAAPPFLT